MLTYLIGNTINQSFAINADAPTALFVTCVKYVITRKLLDMDATLLANTYLFATGKVTRFEISDRMSLDRLAEFDGLSNHPNIKRMLTGTGPVIISVVAAAMVFMARTTDIVPLPI
jgi:hypothetical protein